MNLQPIELRTGQLVTPLGTKYKGFSVEPSSIIFFYQYPYKIRLEGNNTHYNIPEIRKMGIELYDMFTYSHEYKIFENTSSINLYTNNLDVIDTVIENYGHLVVNIVGPIDKDNIKMLETFTPSIIYRNKYWYSKYDTKIEFYVPYKSPVIDTVKLREDIYSFVKENFTMAQWYNSNSRIWVDNFLYCKSEDLKEVSAFLKINFSDYIVNIQKIRLY
jgi:hypothetical protein